MEVELRSLNDLTARTASFYRGREPMDIFGFGQNFYSPSDSIILADLADKGLIPYKHSYCTEYKGVYAKNQAIKLKAEIESQLIKKYAEHNLRSPQKVISASAFNAFLEDIKSIKLAQAPFFIFVGDRRCLELIPHEVELRDKNLDVLVEKFGNIDSRIKGYNNYVIETFQNGTITVLQPVTLYAGASLYDFLSGIKGDRQALYNSLLTEAYIITFGVHEASHLFNYCDSSALLREIYGLIKPILSLNPPTKIEDTSLLEEIGLPITLFSDSPISFTQIGWSVTLLQKLKLLGEIQYCSCQPDRQISFDMVHSIPPCKGCYIYDEMTFYTMCALLAPASRLMIGTRVSFISPEEPEYDKRRRIKLIPNMANILPQLFEFLKLDIYNQILIPVTISWNRNIGHDITFVAVKNNKREVAFAMHDSNISYGTSYWGSYIEDNWNKISGGVKLVHLPIVFDPNDVLNAKSGVQHVEADLASDENEAGGYCTTWSFIFASIAIISGNVDYHAIMTDIIKFMLTLLPEYRESSDKYWFFKEDILPRILRNLVRCVSSNEVYYMAKLRHVSPDKLSQLCCHKATPDKNSDMVIDLT
jgi:hypothetical protein